MAPQTAEQLRQRLGNQQLNAMQEESGIRQGTRSGLELGVTMSNLIPSLKKNMGDIVAAISSPIDTASGLLKVGGGYASKAGIPGLSEFAPYADAMNDMILDRYGSVDNLLNTIETDPVGVMMDFSGVAGVGGKLAKMSGFADEAAMLQTVANVTDPINQAVNLTGATLGRLIPEDTPASVYSGGAKLGSARSADQQARMNRTAVREGILPNDAGLQRLSMLESQLRTQIDDLILEATQNGRTVDATVLFDTLEKMRNAAETGGSTNRPADLAQIEKVERALSRSIYGDEATDYGVTFPKPLNAQELQAIKLDAYSRGYEGTQRGKPSLREQAYQAIGRDARQSVEDLAGPEVGALNQRLGNLLELGARDRSGEMKGPLPTAANRIDRRNTFGLSQVIPGATLAGAGSLGGLGLEGGLLGLLLGSLNNPMVQARTGIALEQLRNMGRNPSTFTNRVPYAPSLLSTGAYSGRATQGLLDRGLPLN